MAKIFISYRREDSQHAVDRLHNGLKPYVSDPDRDIFIDVDNIPLGEDFVDHLDAKVGECDILLAVIGPDWLSIKNPVTGERRLDDPKDFVRIEVAAALRRGIPVVPVLLDGAPVPIQQDLPSDLQALATRNGTQINRLSFDSDVIRLARGLGLINAPDPSETAQSVTPPQVAPSMEKSVLVQPVREPQHGKEDKPKGRKWLLFAGLGVAVAAIAGAVLYYQDSSFGADHTWVEYDSITFGDNSSEYANDDDCDDNRFSGEGHSGLVSQGHVMKDADDCLAAYIAGSVVLTGGDTNVFDDAPILTPLEDLFAGLASGIEFGDDRGEFANDGDCDDGRFHSNGDDFYHRRTHVLHDATDCRVAESQGDVSLVLDFGDDSGAYARDDTCDDHRFEGSGHSGLDILSHMMKDASDCIAAYQADTISRVSN